MSLYCSPLAGNIEKILCGSKRGGLVKEIYVANLGDIASITSSTSDKIYDSIVMNTNPATSNPYFWYRIAFKKNTSGVSNEAQIGNNKFYRQQISFTFEGLDANIHETLDQMIDGEAVFIAVDYQKKVHLLGRINGLEASSITSGTGAAADDLYGGVVTFQGDESETSNFIASGTTIEVLVSPGVTETITF